MSGNASQHKLYPIIRLFLPHWGGGVTPMLRLEKKRKPICPCRIRDFLSVQRECRTVGGGLERLHVWMQVLATSEDRCGSRENLSPLPACKIFKPFFAQQSFTGSLVITPDRDRWPRILALTPAKSGKPVCLSWPAWRPLFKQTLKRRIPWIKIMRLPVCDQAGSDETTSSFSFY